MVRRLNSGIMKIMRTKNYEIVRIGEIVKTVSVECTRPIPVLPFY